MFIQQIILQKTSVLLSWINLSLTMTAWREKRNEYSKCVTITKRLTTIALIDKHWSREPENVVVRTRRLKKEHLASACRMPLMKTSLPVMSRAFLHLTIIHQPRAFRRRIHVILSDIKVTLINMYVARHNIYYFNKYPLTETSTRNISWGVEAAGE
jgi:hypothetical protein